MRKCDVVYILKNNWKIVPEELRYSLRSLANFPHRQVWFFGGMPKGFEPDHADTFLQEGKDRFEKVRNTIIRICETKEVSDDFWLFNDDFFILKKICQEFAYDRGTIMDHYKKLQSIHGYESPYMTELKNAHKALKSAELSTIDYTVHIPMLINKKTALEAISAFPEVHGFRNLYGNFAGVESITIKDVKISNLHRLPEDDWAFLSTSDGSFQSGQVGRWIREQFPEPSKWEVRK